MTTSPSRRVAVDISQSDTLDMIGRVMEYGDITKDGTLKLDRSYVVEGLRMAVGQPEMSMMLATVIGRENGAGGATLKSLVEAGESLAGFEALDASFTVARPGIEAGYNRWSEVESPKSKKGQFSLMGVSRRDMKNGPVVEVIRKTITRGLSAANS